MLDGKTMLTESLPFPKVSDADFRDDSASSLLPLRRKNPQSSTCPGFGGSTVKQEFTCGNVSDTSLGTFRRDWRYNGY
jgi:hypothetical protein